ncbi:Fe2+-dependent dioxygenase [Rheinheimera soli]|jgi:PKHD-type hydroxylase|uniref:PKHD-type hydroxylase n=1 Tax=Rheinheimera soli TaxID=443616 RepID=A0ABU1W3R9_9GAMM|nr:Fe2+-dependent dioxygenase [Rheinheimera soli]MDR7122574.1 PKHD-type hydroxylase [Rheinheimera soli]
MLIHIPDLLSKAQVTEFRQLLDAADWTDGRVTVGPQGALVKQNKQLAVESPLAKQLGAVILQALYQHPLFMAAAIPLRTVPPLFNSYQGGEHYGLHVDGAIRGLPGSGLSLRTDLSSTLFLSEPEDYQGGELQITDTFGVHEIKLPAGDLILYPSSSLHQVLPVTSGERVCSFFWTQSMVRNDQQRSMLFELDQTIQQLRAQHGDSSQLLALTGHYHNLVRLWAEL